MLELFIYKTEIKIVLGGDCSCQQMAIEFLLSFTKKVESDSELLILGIYNMQFYIVWHSSQPLLSQTMANQILGCLPTISYHGGVPIFISLTF